MFESHGGLYINRAQITIGEVANTDIAWSRNWVWSVDKKVQTQGVSSGTCDTPQPFEGLLESNRM